MAPVTVCGHRGWESTGRGRSAIHDTVTPAYTAVRMSREQSRQRGLLLVISGPSGSGKTTIARAVERRLEGTFSVSATTRKVRSCESSTVGLLRASDQNSS